MLKQVLVISFLFTLIACVPETEKIKSGGDCTNGSCGGKKPGQKPSVCGSGQAFKTIVGETFRTIESQSGGVSYQTEITFNNTTFAYTQFCAKEGNALSPSVVAEYSFYPAQSLLTFRTGGESQQSFGTLNCKASVAPENFKYRIEGKCLVLTGTGSSQSAIYFIRQ